MKKFLFLVNPVSGKSAGKLMMEMILSEIKALFAHDQFDIALTRQDIASQVREVSEQYEAVVAVGGDGTLSPVVQEVAKLEHKPKVGLVPIGTGNDFALSLGIMQVLEQWGLKSLLKMVLRGNTRPIDIIGLSQSRIWTNYVGIGCDAKVSNDFNRLRGIGLLRSGFMKHFNKMFYVLIGLKNMFYRLPFDVELNYRDESSQTQSLAVPRGTLGIILSNVMTYAGGALLSSNGSLHDGKFEVTVIPGLREWIMLHCTRFFKRPLNLLCPGILQVQTDRLEMCFSGETFYQVDGEIFDEPSGQKICLVMEVKGRVDIIAP